MQAQYTFPWFGGPYRYAVSVYRLRGKKAVFLRDLTLDLTGIEIELELNTYWELLAPGTYHDLFYTGRQLMPQRAHIPQVIGSLGEVVTVIAMRACYGAENIKPLKPHPSSKTADFEMEIVAGRSAETVIVEAKATNRPMGEPSMGFIRIALAQIAAVRGSSPGKYGRAFVTMISYPSANIFVVEVP